MRRYKHEETYSAHAERRQLGRSSGTKFVGCDATGAPHATTVPSSLIAAKAPKLLHTSRTPSEGYCRRLQNLLRWHRLTRRMPKWILGGVCWSCPAACHLSPRFPNSQRPRRLSPQGHFKRNLLLARLTICSLKPNTRMQHSVR